MGLANAEVTFSSNGLRGVVCFWAHGSKCLDPKQDFRTLNLLLHFNGNDHYYSVICEARQDDITQL